MVIPHFGDQHFWGIRVAALGVGSQPIPRKKLTTDLLAEAIQAVTSDQAMRSRASSLGEQIRQEDGVGRAVKVIEAALATDNP